MARPTEYNIDDVLDKAMDIFWEKGYEAVSMAQIVDETGLNRRTMYSLFKDKEGLFRDALDHYYAQQSSSKITILRDNYGKKGIEIFFESFMFGEDFRGCLFSNTMREKSLLSEETYNIPKNYFDRVTDEIVKNLEEAKIEGDFSGDSRATALTIITFIHGFHVYGKYNNSKEDGSFIIKTLLNMIQ